MDPIYYQVNQTRMQEVTQKSSDNLRMQQSKELKNRVKKSSEIDEGDLEADSQLLSEDMLGDMDPDLFGGGAAGFSRMWEEELENEDRPPPEGDGQGQGEEDESEPQDERQPDEEEAPPQPKSVAGEVEANPVAVAPPIPKPPAPVAAVAAAAAPPVKVGAPPSVAPPQGKLSSLGSLLDLSGGFLISDDPPEVEEVVALPPVEEPEEVEAPLAPGLTELFEKLLVGDVTSAGYRRIQRLLGRFGAGVIRACVEHKIKVYLLPDGAQMADHPVVQSASLGHSAEAAYLPSARACVFEERCLAAAPYGFHPVLFYFAHAFDHVLGGEEFASLRSPAVNASFQACQDGPHRFADGLAGHTQVHYFAQAVESYLSENETLDPIWTRQDLYDFDRSMYDYVEYLLQRKNGK